MNEHTSSVAPAVCAVLAISVAIMLSGCQSTSSASSTTAEASPPQESSPSPAASPSPTGSPSTAGAPGPQQQTTDQANGQSGSPAGRTTQEVIGDLDGELDTSIAVFDGMILDERAKAEAIAEASGGDHAASEDSEEALFEEGDLNEGLPGYGEFPEAASADGEDGGGDESAAEPGSAGTASDENGEPAVGTSGSGSRAPGSSPGVKPADIGNGNDDDIVARQIREAALKEKDPVLRDKLWDEYRKYKNQQRAQ